MATKPTSAQTQRMLRVGEQVRAAITRFFSAAKCATT
jgi:ribosome-binding factor A